MYINVALGSLLAGDRFITLLTCRAGEVMGADGRGDGVEVEVRGQRLTLHKGVVVRWWRDR